MSEKTSELELSYDQQQAFGEWVLTHFAPDHVNKVGHGVKGVDPLKEREATVRCKCGKTVTITHAQYMYISQRAA